MSTGYEIVSTTFTIGPTDSRIQHPLYAPPYALVTATAPAGKRWVCRANSTAYDSVNGTEYAADEGVALNEDGTEYTANVNMDIDGSGQPVETARTVRVIAVDA